MTLFPPFLPGETLDGAPIELRPMGDQAILVRLMLPPGLTSPSALSPDQRYTRMLAARLLSVYLQDNVPAGPGWPREFVPGYDNVLAPFDPEYLSRAAFGDWLAGQLETVITGWKTGGLPDSVSPRLHHLPVIYGGQRGPDLEKVARRNNLSPEEVVKIHSSVEYSVYLVGFAPGFAYLGALPPAIDAPRLDRPRPSVPGGTVALAAGLTGVYPLASQPGGWNLVGYTPLALFDATQDPPVRFLPGDRVRFYPISEADLPGLQAARASLAPTEDRL
jgi:inhibitor of KinA